MKKTFAIFASLFLLAGSVFAQSTASALPDEEIKVDLTKKVITPSDQHLMPEDKTGKVVIEYTPMVDEVRITYTCMYNLYEPGNAMNAIMGCLEDFTKENKYYHYKYMERDREKYYKDNRGIRWAQYISHVKFTR
ncbi:MAG: hypothetical protein K6E78_05525 [Treponema sp.]|nr:hypothetical protein [Treponema sp.]